MTCEANLIQSRARGPMRVILPISVAYDLDKFQRALANLAQLLGAEVWTSASDARLLQGREFLVDPTSLEASEVGQQ